MIGNALRKFGVMLRGSKQVEGNPIEEEKLRHGYRGLNRVVACRMPPCEITADIRPLEEGLRRAEKILDRGTFVTTISSSSDTVSQVTT